MSNNQLQSFASWRILAVICGAILLGYIGYRAVAVPLYSDEVFTYQYFVSIGDFLPFFSRADANNHVLHSLLMYISVGIFGDHIWAWRLPNIIGFAIYFFFAIKLVLSLRSVWVKWFTILGLTAPLYLLQFFSLARGYGLSLAFLLGAIYFLSRPKSKWNLFYFLVLALCTVWSNLGILIPIGILTLWNLLKNKSTVLQKSFWTDSPLFTTFFSSVLALLIIAPVYALYLQEKGALYLGDNLTFSETFGGLGKRLFPLYLRNREWIILVLGVLALPWNLLISKNRKGFWPSISLALWGTLLSLFILKHVLGINYPVARAALHFYPLVIISIAFNLQALSRYLRLAPALFGIGALMYQLFHEFNVHYAPEWRTVTLNDTFYHYLQKWKIDNNRIPTVSGSRFLGMLLEENDRRHNWDINSFQRCGKKSAVTDFLLINNWKQNTMGYAYDTVYRDDKTSTTLLTRTQLLQWRSIGKEGLHQIKEKSQSILMARLDNRTLNQDTIGVDLSMTFKYGYFPYKAKILIQTMDSLSQITKIEEVPLWAPLVNAKSDVKFSRRVALPATPFNSKISVYLTQQKKNETRLSDINIEWYNLTEPRKQNNQPKPNI